MSRYEVLKVEGRSGLEAFLGLPERLYQLDPNWTRPVLPDERRMLSADNPYLADAEIELFLCTRDGEPVARLAVVHDRRLRSAGEPLDTFGYFETVDDRRAVETLFDAARRRCRERGIHALEGPFNPSHYAPAGIQLDRHDLPPATFQTYNPPWYAAALARAGLRLTTTATIWRGARPPRSGTPEPLRRGSSGYQVRHVPPEELLSGGTDILALLNASFVANHRFVPVREEELAFMAEQLLPSVLRGSVCVLDHDGEVVGAALGIVDLGPQIRRGRLPEALTGRATNGEAETLIIYAIGLHERHRHSRGGLILMHGVMEMIGRYRAAESSWIDDTNTPSIAMARRVGMRPLKRYGLFTATF